MDSVCRVLLIRTVDMNKLAINIVGGWCVAYVCSHIDLPSCLQNLRMKMKRILQKLDALIDTFFPNLPVDLNGIIYHGFASLALREDWPRGILSENHCLWQTSVFWNEKIIDMKNCVKLELGVGENNLELNHVSTRERNCTRIPNHVVLLASQRSLFLQQKKRITNNDSIPLLIQNAVKTREL